jgi:hypothetical protein
MNSIRRIHVECTSPAAEQMRGHVRKVTPRQVIGTLAVGVALTLLASCASTSMVSSKKNPAYSGPELKRLMVIGATADPKVRPYIPHIVISAGP